MKASSGAWELRQYEMGIKHVLGSARNCTYERALRMFAANWPERADVAALLADWQELCGLPAGRATSAGGAPAGGATPKRARGSGARFRELMAAGASNADALATVRAEFPDSRATLSDAAWNRAKMAKAAAGAAASGGGDRDGLF